MPFYEYECKSCQETFTTLRPISERDNPTPCPGCGSEKVQRKVSAFAAGAAGAGKRSRGASCNTTGFG